MAEFVIEGGHPISGRIRAAGNKNAALPCLACTLLGNAPVKLSNVPRIGDVETMLAMVESTGAKLTWDGEHTVTVDATNIAPPEVDEKTHGRVRGGILLAAPLLHRFGEVELPFPGGDRIGRRRLDTHLLALEMMGARVSLDTRIRITAPSGLSGADILLDEASVTATENTVMAAVLARGKTVIRNAACEPHVQELCRLLLSMGADIEGIGTNELRIHGVQNLGGGELEIGADYIEVASLMVLAAVTRGELLIENASPAYLRMILFQFRRLGIVAEIREQDLWIPRAQRIAIQADFRGAIPKVDDGPWPGFPADLTSIATVAAIQAEGSVIIFEKMFESRMFFVDQLIEMGAKIVLCDPHRAVVIGPSHLRGSRMTSPDIRAGMALLIAALGAEGQSVIGNIEQIDRGYERIDQRLRTLGARIERREG